MDKLKSVPYQTGKPKRNGWMSWFIWPIKVNQDQITNLNRFVIPIEIEAIVKIFELVKAEIGWIQWRILQDLQRLSMSILFKLLHKIETEVTLPW